MAMTTVGYGDIEPVLPPSRALSTLMAVSGQMYLAGVMAVLVGKFLEKGGRERF
jgi:voltage-gated potassium channel